MSTQLHNYNYMSRRKSQPGGNPICLERDCVENKIYPLKASSVDAEVMWKEQAFKFARDRLWGRLVGYVLADSIIAVIGEHFIMTTMTAKQEV